MSTIIQRLVSRLVTSPTGCIEWTGTHNTAGYGVIRIGCPDGQYRNVLTHRLAWELAKGPIPNQLHVCHHCDNPPCVNVDHLFLGTDADNATDRTTKGRSFTGAPRIGTANASAKLSPGKALWIRQSFTTGMSRAAIAASLDVGLSTVNRVIHGESWTA